MPELKTVYFAPDGKWFETIEACEAYEQREALQAVILTAGVNEDAAKKIARAVLAAYDLYPKTMGV